MGKNFRTAYLPISLILHFVWLVVFAYLILAGPFGSNYTAVLLFIDQIDCDECKRSADAIYSAAQMGRLELVSISLTILATVVGVGAFGSFFLLRGGAMDAAANEAIEYVDKNLNDLITPDVIAKSIYENPRTMLSIATIIKKQMEDSSNSISDDDADGIAKAMEGDEND